MNAFNIAALVILALIIGFVVGAIIIRKGKAFPIKRRPEGEFPICVSCNRPVKVNKEEYLTFEKMHWICFHFEFEHGEYDPDEPCEDPSCPWKWKS